MKVSNNGIKRTNESSAMVPTLFYACNHCGVIISQEKKVNVNGQPVE